MTLLKDGLNSMIETSYFSIFPTNIMGFRIDDSKEMNSAIATHLLERQKVEVNNNHNSVQGGWHSSFNLLHREEQWSKDLEDMILSVVKDFVAHYNGPHFWDKQVEDARLQCWGFVLGAGHCSTYHTHPGSVVSGTYYVKVPEGMQKDEDVSSGRFNIPDFRCGPTSSPEWITPNFKYDPEEGMGLVFPSWVPHFVEPHYEEGERISISWNTQLVLKPTK